MATSRRLGMPGGSRSIAFERTIRAGRCAPLPAVVGGSVIRMEDRPTRVRVVAEPGFEDAARTWASRLGPSTADPTDFELIVGAEGLGLRPSRVGVNATARALPPLRVQLGHARPGSEEVVRAVRGRRPLRELGRVVDATAGLGVDAAALARAGLDVTMIERDEVVHALLEDALSRLRQEGEGADLGLAARMALIFGEAEEVLARMPPPDVVYLDPLYPEGRGAAKRRPMAWVRELQGGRASSPEHDRRLLAAARRAATRRVVVKRPARAPPLAGDVSGSLRGRTTRFDLYAPVPPGPA